MYKLEKQTQMIKDKRGYIIIELICINFNKLVYIELSIIKNKALIYPKGKSVLFLMFKTKFLIHCRSPPSSIQFANFKLNGGEKLNIEGNKKIFKVDENEIVADFDNNKYYITFKNFNGEEITSEIPKEIFDIYVESKRNYKKNQNEEERHWEKTELTENTIYKRGNKYHESIETTVINNEMKQNLYIAVSKLPLIQRRRIKMKYFEEMKEKKLAEKEKISIRAIQYSLHYGIENLKKFFN